MTVITVRFLYSVSTSEQIIFQNFIRNVTVCISPPHCIHSGKLGSSEVSFYVHLCGFKLSPACAFNYTTGTDKRDLLATFVISRARSETGWSKHVLLRGFATRLCTRCAICNVQCAMKAAFLNFFSTFSESF